MAVAEKKTDINLEIEELKKSKEKEEKRNKELEKTILAEQKNNKEMKSTIDLLQKQLEETQRMILNLSTNTNNIAPQSSEEKLYPITNMFIGELILLNGDVTFEKHGDIIDLPKSIIREMVQKHKKFAEKGYFYISDEELVKEFRLTKYYARMLTVEEMEHFFDLSTKDIEKLYNKAPEGQQQVIIDQALNAQKYGLDISAEKLILLSRLSGKKLVEI